MFDFPFFTFSRQQLRIYDKNRIKHVISPITITISVLVDARFRPSNHIVRSVKRRRKKKKKTVVAAFVANYRLLHNNRNIGGREFDNDDFENLHGNFKRRFQDVSNMEMWKLGRSVRVQM